jgi:hypothetical protein
VNSELPNFRGISRLEQEASGTYGWQVRIQRKGVRHGRFFSDYEWGGPERALTFALQFRDKVVAHLERLSELPGHRAARTHALPSARNQSGVVGVIKISQRSAKGDEYHFWQASWTDPDGTRRFVRFSVLKLGDLRAFELACAARENALSS